MFGVQVDARLGLVETRLVGMLSVAEVGSYVALIQREFIAASLRDYVMIVDISNCPIQTQDVVAAMREHMTRMPKARAIAIVTGSSLGRMQIRRLFTQPYTRIVGTMAAGRAWVLSGIEPADDHPVRAPAV